MQIFPEHFGSIRSEQLNSQINLLIRFALIKFLNSGVLLSYFEYLHIQLSMSIHYIYCTSEFKDWQPILFL